MAKTRVSQGANGQYKLTVPKGLAEAMDLEGKRLDWKVKSGSLLEMTVVDDDNELPSYQEVVAND